MPATASMAELTQHAEDSWSVVDTPIERLFGPAEKINITVPGRGTGEDRRVRQEPRHAAGFLVQAAQEAIAHGA